MKFPYQRILFPLLATVLVALLSYTSVAYAFLDNQEEVQTFYQATRTPDKRQDFFLTTKDPEAFLYLLRLYSDNHITRAKMFALSLENPIINDIVSLDCGLFTEHYLYDKEHAPTILLKALLGENHEFLQELTACRDTLSRDNRYFSRSPVSKVTTQVLLDYVRQLKQEPEEKKLTTTFYWLLRRGANFNAQYEGHTGLYYAVQQGHMTLAKLYLKYGAEPLSDQELAELNCSDNTFLKQHKRYTAHAKEILQREMSPETMLATLEQFEDNPASFDFLPVTAKGKLIALMVEPQPGTIMSVFNPNLLQRRKKLILHLYRSLESYRQLHQALAYNMKVKSPLGYTRDECRQLKQITSDNAKLIDESIGFSKEFDRESVYGKANYLLQLQDNNICTLPRDEIRFGPG